MKQADYIETYLHFPEVIRAGSFRLTASELDYLKKEGFTELYRTDTFGKIFSLTKKGKLFFPFPEYLKIDGCQAIFFLLPMLAFNTSIRSFTFESVFSEVATRIFLPDAFALMIFSISVT